jgi:peptidoglycan/LPS O-acetylase OafA/YrhL
LFARTTAGLAVDTAGRRHPTAAAHSRREKILPSLDLLRSYAIVAVVTAHTVLSFGAPAALAPLQLGGTGVDLFFVLSGWLLGRQLMLELQQHNNVRLVRFWSRRWMRTLPAYYAVLLATALQMIALGGHQDLRWSYLVFGQNYLPHLTAFYVSWSLCVEEHFYLLVAPVVVILSRLKTYRIPLIAAVFATPLVCRQLGWYVSGNETHVRWDECAFGVALAATSVFAPRAWSALCRNAPAMASIAAVMYAFNFWARWHPQYAIIRDYDRAVYALIFGSFVVLANASPWWERRLYLPGASYLAKRAYSVYLLHPESLALLKHAHIESFVVLSVLTWAITLLGAELLYRCVELPIMRARDRFRFSGASQPPAAPVSLCA